MPTTQEKDALVEIRVRITRRQRRLLKIYQLQNDMEKDEAVRDVLKQFFEREGER